MDFTIFHWRSLKTRVTLLTLIVFLIGIWGLSLYGSRLLQVQMQRALADQQFSMATYVASDVNEAINVRIMALELLAKRITPTMLKNPGTLQAMLEDRQADYVLFNNGIATAGTDGSVIAEYPHLPGRMGANFKERDYVAGPLKDGKTTVGRPVMSKVMHAPVFVIGVPVRDPQGGVIGVVGGVTDLRLPNFLDSITQGHYGTTGGLFVASRQHRLIITASDKRRVMEQIPALGTDPLIDARAKGQDGTAMFVNPRGVEVLSSAKGVPVADWFVVVSLPTQEAFAPIRDVQKQLLLATIFLTLMTGVLVWWVVKHQLAPMLVTAQTLSEAGQYPVKPLPIARQDEVGALIGGFNRLLGDLAQRQESLKDSEARYRNLTEWSPEPLVVHDRNKFLYVNPAAIKMFGAKSAQELVGKPIFDLIHPDSIDVVRARLRAGIDHGGTLPMIEEKFLRLDSATIVVEVQSTSVIYEGAAVVQVAMRDVTQSKQDRQAILLQAQRSEVLLKLPAAAETRDEKAFVQYGLEMAEQLTGSQIAFVHFVHDDQETIELLAWSQATLKDYCTATFDRHYPVSQAGIWADALRQRAPVLINDDAVAAGKHGLPEGLAHLGRLISVPVIEAGLVRMMLGVGNKPQGYTAFDLETTRLVADTIWRIVHQRRADTAIRESQESLKEAQRIAGIGSYVLDVSSGHWESSEELDRLFGIDTKYERSIQGWEALIHPEDRAMMDDYLRNQVVGQSQNFNKEYRIQRHDDQTLCWVQGLGRLEFDSQGQLVRMRGTIQDITEHKLAEQQIQALAFSDPLTGLPNRRLLMDRLEQALAAASRHGHQNALLFIDLDDFKTLNDTLGHDKGDLLLKQITQRLIGCVREIDTVARLGGDEFVVLLQDLSSTTQEAATLAQVVAAKILSALGQPYELEGHGHHSTASIGITLVGGAQRENIDEPLKRAELAMYQAKATGRNTLRFFEPEMRTAVAARATLEADLRDAVIKCQFLLYYQPQWGHDVHLSGVEALVRWQHPHRGLVSPLEFIPIAEASGLILPLGRWVLQTACKQLATWAVRPERSHLTMAVNVSARQIRQPDFVQEVLTILEETGAKPGRLKLELTESVLLDNVTDTIAKMRALKAKGVGFSLDDFGIGYSSLSYLKLLPLDQLKIDQGFVRDILTDPNDAAIAKMVVALAKSVGLEVIAEGVETEEQRDFLANLGCHNYQGYLFSRPVPIEEFEEFAARNIA